jgi:hypothetical protein
VTEGLVYVCRWTLRRGIYRVWVKGKPSISAEASSFEVADERLNEAIAYATGDGENRREYVPPIDAEQEDHGPLVVRLKRLVPETRVETLNKTELFDGGLCTECGMPLGPRTQVPIIVERLPTTSDGIRLESQRLFTGLHKMQGYSGNFLDTLTGAERHRFEWRPIESRSKQKRKFFELLGGRIHAPYVALSGVGVSLNECAACGWRRPPFYSIEPPIPTQFVVRSALPRRIPSMLCVGTLFEPQLCTTPSRWAQLSDRGTGRRISAATIGVIEQESVDENPVYDRF